MSPNRTSKAVVLLGHGTRKSPQARPFEEICRWMEQDLPGLRVVDAYLSLCPPTLSEAVDSLKLEGFSQVDIIPMFLVEGHHVQEDIPLAMEAIVKMHPQLELRLSPTLSMDRAILPLLRKRLDQAKPLLERNLTY